MYYKLPETQEWPPCALSKLSCFFSTLPLAGLPLLCLVTSYSTPYSNTPNFSTFLKNFLGPRPPFSRHTLHTHSTTQAHVPRSFQTYPTNTHAHVCIHMNTHCIHTHLHPLSTQHMHTHAHIARHQHPASWSPLQGPLEGSQASCSSGL